MLQPPHQLLHGLRAAADTTRLRLLSLLALGEFAVTELTGILGQSQPRVSRHLRLMTEAGLLERFREQHWVYYRLAVDGEGAAVARALLGLLDRDDASIAADRERAEAVLAARASGAATAAAPADGMPAVDDGELARIVCADFEERGYEALLYVGPAPTQVLKVLGPRARRVVGLSPSRAEVQRARASLHGAGLSHCTLHQGDLQALAGEAGRFDVVVLDRVLASRGQPERALADAARLLRPGGRAVLVEDYDALASRAAADNPLALLRDWLARSGLLCARMRPVDTGTAHLLLATAASEQGQAAA